MEELLAEKKTEHPILTGIQTVSDTEELHSGRIYIMDRRSPAADKSAAPATGSVEQSDENVQDTALPSQEEDTPRAESLTRAAQIHHEGCTALCAVFAVIGTIAGIIIALAFPLHSSDFSILAEPSDIGFAAAFFERLQQCGAFLLAAYLLGYFAAGGVVVWLVPLVYGMGAGLSCAGGIAAGGSVAAVLPWVVCLALVVSASAASWEFSSVLLRLISGRSGSVITRGSAAYSYNLRFGVYMLVLLAISIAESVTRTAFQG